MSYERSMVVNTKIIKRILIISLAKEKGFETLLSEILNMDNMFHLWLCELQKWLREKHKLYITSVPIIHNENMTPSYYRTLKYDCTFFDCGRSDTFEEALEKGLFEALKLIK